MTNGARTLNGIAARLLGSEECEAVLGDLQEAGESVWRGVLEISGLIVRRRLQLWQHWQPWVAGFGLALPCSLALMGISVSVSRTSLGLLDPRTLIGSTSAVSRYAVLPFICQILMLLAGAWAGGFVVGSISRRTLWVSAVLCCLPCLFCLSRFRIESLSRFSLLLFVVPAIMGVRRALRSPQVGLRPAAISAVVLSPCMIFLWSNSGRIYMLDGALIWPAWYVVASARRIRPQSDELNTWE